MEMERSDIREPEAQNQIWAKELNFMLRDLGSEPNTKDEQKDKTENLLHKHGIDRLQIAASASACQWCDAGRCYRGGQTRESSR